MLCRILKKNGWDYQMVTGMHLSLKKNGPMIPPLWYLVVKLRMVCLMVMRLMPKEMTLGRYFVCLSTFACSEFNIKEVKAL